MTKPLIAVIVFGLLTLTVPWWWMGVDESSSAGIAAWVIYAMAMNVIFAVAVAWLLQRYWSVFERDDDPPHRSDEH